MEINVDKRIFDLIVVGNGIAAQSFLWNLSNNANKSQNFSVAHVYSHKIAPTCSMKSTATVSLNGIEDNVSPLGNDLRDSFFLFENFVKAYSPLGVEKVKRVVIATNENESKKLLRRYKSLSEIRSDKFHEVEWPGVVYDSYLVSPEIFSSWLEKETRLPKTDFPFFVKDVIKNVDNYQLNLENNDQIFGKKILFATGAYSKIFSHFYSVNSTVGNDSELKNIIKSGAYLEKDVDLMTASFYLSIDGNEVIYRSNKNEKKLIIGSATIIGAYEVVDLVLLQSIFIKLKSMLTFDIGNFSDFKIVTGLRHKGPKRLMICRSLNSSDSEDSHNELFQINGLYKNGYSLSFLAANRMMDLMFKS